MKKQHFFSVVLCTMLVVIMHVVGSHICLKIKTMSDLVGSHQIMGIRQVSHEFPCIMFRRTTFPPYQVVGDHLVGSVMPLAFAVAQGLHTMI
jgi:hypothetical protein